MQHPLTGLFPSSSKEKLSMNAHIKVSILRAVYVLLANHHRLVTSCRPPGAQLVPVAAGDDVTNSFSAKRHSAGR
jgi:hypothetical protein